MTDERKSFIARCVLDTLNVSNPNSGPWARSASELESWLQAASEVGDFLEDASVMVLHVRVVPGGRGKDLAMSTAISPPTNTLEGEGSGVVFTKQFTAERITDRNVSAAVAVSSLQAPPLDALQTSLKQLYAPLLQGMGSQLDPKVLESLRALDAQLSAAAARAAGGSGGEDDTSSVRTPHDECEFWRRRAMGGGRGGNAEEYWAALMPVAEKLGAFAQLPMEEMRELLEPLQDALDALHRAGYTEERMLHFLRVLGAAFDAYVQAALSKVSLWREPFKKVGKAVRECSHLLEAWEGCTARLTTTFWAGSWKAGRFSDARLASLQQRLSEVLLLRRVAQQMGALLGEGGGNGDGKENGAPGGAIDSAFGAFDGVNALRHSEYSAPEWEAARKAVHAALAPSEREVALRLQSKLSTSGLKGHALLRELMRYKELATRPLVFQELAPARERLLGELEQQTEALREEFEARTTSSKALGATGKNLPEVVSHIVLAKQLQAKAAEMAAAAALLFSDLQAVGRFKGKVEELENYMVDYSNSQYSDWCEEVERDLQDEASGLPMQLTGKLMEVDRDDADKLLRVNFSDRLVRFLREVRLLSSLGFKMTPLVQGNADVAHKFYRHGVVLKQVANFYNTIDTQIVNSQKPLLLDHALRFEQLATTPKAQQTANAAGGGKEITWSDPTQLEGYIDELRGCSEELMQENRKLRQVRLGHAPTPSQTSHPTTHPTSLTPRLSRRCARCTARWASRCAR